MPLKLSNSLENIEKILNENNIHIARITDLHAVKTSDSYPLLKNELPKGNYIVASIELFIPVTED